MAQTITAQLASEVRDAQTVLDGFDNAYNNLQNAAEQMNDCGFLDSALACKDKFRQLLQLEQEFKIQIKGLKSMQHDYAMPDGEAQETNFAAKYDSALQQFSHERVNVENLDKYKNFDSLLERMQNEAGTHDEDLEMEDNNQLAPNQQCPLTHKSLMDLEEPVEDNKGFVYEKDAIHAHIRRAGGTGVQCPVAGTEHQVNLSHLRPARKVIRALKGKTNATQAAPEEEDDVFDVE